MALKLTNQSQLTQDTLTKILQRFLEDDSVRLSDIAGNLDFLKENDNFNSEVKKWAIKVTRGKEGHETEETLSLIVKSSPTGFFQRRMSTIARPFSREVFWLNCAFPTLRQLCPEISGLSPVSYYAYSNYVDSLMGKKRFREKMCCMPCYPLAIEEEKGLVLLEDLCSRETPLHVMTKTDIMTFEQAKTVFESLAKFHGAWLKWRHLAEIGEMGDIGPLKLEHLASITLDFKPWMIRAMFAKTAELVLMLLKSHNEDEGIIRKWQNYVKVKFQNEAVKCFDKNAEERDSKIITVTHGDMWSNNLLFSPDSEKVVFIDFQMIGPSHPARDLWYLLTVNTDRAFRTNYLDILLKAYFDVFNQYLVDIKINMTFDEFSKEFYERRHLAFALGLQTMPNVLSPNPIELKGLNPMGKVYEKQRQELGGVPSPDDHPTIIEIRRRIIDMVLEAAECDFI